MKQSPKRGRPPVSENKKEEMRQKIAISTQALFQQDGYRQISMRRIAREVGCSTMTLYKYYESKADILHTLWAEVFREVYVRLNKLELVTQSPEERLKQLASHYVNYWLENTDHYRLVFMTEGIKQAEVSVFINSPKIIAHQQLLAQAIAATSAKQLSKQAIKQKLDTMVCFLQGITHNLITMSGYNWPKTDTLIDAAIRSVAIPE